MGRGKARREALRRADHDRRPDVAVRGARAARHDLLDPGLLVDRHAPPLDRRGQPRGERGRVDARAVRMPQGPERPGDPHALGGGRGIRPLEVGVGPGRLGIGERAQPRELGGRARDGQFAALVRADVDALTGGDREHLVDRVVERALLGDRGLAAVAADVALAAARHRVGEPAAVAARGAVAREALLDHRDPQRRIEARERVRRPESGVAGADDAHVRLDRPCKRRARRGRPAPTRPPERHLTVAGHACAPIPAILGILPADRRMPRGAGPRGIRFSRRVPPRRRLTRCRRGTASRPRSSGTSGTPLAAPPRGTPLPRRRTGRRRGGRPRPAPAR
ncbi:hypothetical protein RR49_01412 [Microbacterium ginsengisoli]|uniref:Uncharacterized protein n=1 Tax=Microbacterium ginsengisoli TaxID=400772 RepID=A0A0F0LVZ9_9MICO|nr:hypothetical protein RR49_01412 [Microbacterium ginsengisoli]